MSVPGLTSQFLEGVLQMCDPVFQRYHFVYHGKATDRKPRNAEPQQSVRSFLPAYKIPNLGVYENIIVWLNIIKKLLLIIVIMKM